MKSIKDTFIFEMQDKASALKSKMLAYNPDLDDLDITKIDEQLGIIKRRFNYPAKNVILNDLGVTIKPIFNKDRIMLPSYLPAYLYNNPRPIGTGDKVIAVVNITNYATYDKKNDLVNIEPKQLFGLIQTGEVLLTCFHKWNSITMSQSICKLGSLLYSRIFVKVLDRMFAINFDPIKADKLKFISSKFFLLNMLEKTSGSEIINNISYANCTNGITRNTINQFNEEFNQNAYKNFANLIQQIALEIDGCHSLTVRSFLDTAIKMYGPSCVLAFEYFPLFLHLVFSVVIGARFNAEFVLESVLGKEADQLYNEFVNMMRK